MSYFNGDYRRLRYGVRTKTIMKKSRDAVFILIITKTKFKERTKADESRLCFLLRIDIKDFIAKNYARCLPTCFDHWILLVKGVVLLMNENLVMSHIKESTEF